MTERHCHIVPLTHLLSLLSPPSCTQHTHLSTLHLLNLSSAPFIVIVVHLSQVDDSIRQLSPSPCPSALRKLGPQSRCDLSTLTCNQTQTFSPDRGSACLPTLKGKKAHSSTTRDWTYTSSTVRSYSLSDFGHPSASHCRLHVHLHLSRLAPAAVDLLIGNIRSSPFTLARAHSARDPNFGQNVSSSTPQPGWLSQDLLQCERAIRHSGCRR